MGDVEIQNELQELRNVVDHLKSLKNDNERLKTNFDNLKNMHLNVSENYQQLQEKYTKLYDERVSVENHYQQLCQSWRDELERKQKDFEEAKSQIMQPRELDLLRLRLMEELEAPQREKCQTLEKEAEAASQKYAEARREQELLRTDVQSMAAKHANEVAYLKTENESALSRLSGQVERLQAALSLEESNGARVRQLQKEASSAGTLAKRLQDEVEDLRNNRERATVDRQRLVADYEQQLRNLEAEKDSSARQLEVSVRKVLHLEGELQQATRGNDELHQQMLQLENARNALSLQVAEAIKKHDGEREGWQKQKLSLERQIEESKQKLEESTFEKERALAQSAATHADDMSHKETQAKLQLAQAEDQAQVVRNRLEAEVAEARKTAESAQRQQDEAHKKSTEQMTALQQEAAGLREEGSEKHKALTEMQSKHAQLKDEMSELRTTSALQQKESEAVKEKLESETSAREAAQAQLEAVRTTHTQVGMQLDHARLEINDLKENQEKQLSDSHKMLDSLKSQWELEKAVLQRQSVQLKQQFNEKHSKVIKTAKQKLHGYQKKLAHASKYKARAQDYERMVYELQHKVEKSRPKEEDEDMSKYATQLAAFKERQSKFLMAAHSTNID
ncbi:hypothetical protein CYMTET_48579 [Cymbomonas tetramitiformis]|uniref:Uncharacterized protein n=1 Tax=Cymbomonas tetramitiformis TaxID=36881 RepID=A0AAE0BS39_9CHLO|nr:hypothetical protein CYMTET_48579 [Cymbomonas tetramitiformis]